MDLLTQERVKPWTSKWNQMLLCGVTQRKLTRQCTALVWTSSSYCGSSVDANQQPSLEYHLIFFFWAILANSVERKKFSGWIWAVAFLSFVCLWSAVYWAGDSTAYCGVGQHACSGVCHSQLVHKRYDLLPVLVKGERTTVNPLNFSLLIVGLFGPDMELVVFVSFRCITKEKWLAFEHLKPAHTLMVNAF